MTDAVTTLVAVVIGGVLSLGGTIWVATYQAKREERRLAKERLRENLYHLQETLEEVFREYDAAMKAPPTVAPHPGVTSAVIRINMHSVRVGDDSLAVALSAILEKLSEARRADASHVKGAAYNTALDLLSPVHQRIGELLHTDAKVDLGTG